MRKIILDLLRRIGLATGFGLIALAWGKAASLVDTLHIVAVIGAGIVGFFAPAFRTTEKRQ